MPRLLVAGCGYLGVEIARLAVREAWDVVGVTRRETSRDALRDEPYPVIAADLADPASACRLPSPAPDAAILCLSSGRGNVDAYRSAYVEATRSMIEAWPTARFVFAGSTSVYAQTQGELVDETSVAEPVRETGHILLEAEQIILERGGYVGRLAGLYGPGRSALLRKFMAGTAIIEAGGQRWLNMIHRDDAASALLRLAGDDAAPGVYNVSDGHPIRQKDLYAFLADQTGKPLPPDGPADLGRKRGWTSKRVANAKLLATGWRPRFGSFQAAFALHGMDLAADL